MTGGWTEADVRKVLNRQQVGTQTVKRSKYGAKRVVYDGHTFHSTRECEYYKELRIRESAGEVKDIRCQVPYQLVTIPTTMDLRIEPLVLLQSVAEYRADFVFLEFGELVVADVKGAKRNTESFQIKKRWMQAQYGIDIREVR